MRRPTGVIAALFVVAAGAWAQQGDRGLEVRVRALAGDYATAGKQYAVFIAIDRYRNWGALSNPVKDAREIRDILTRRYYVDEVIELYDADATKAGINRLFGGLIERTVPEDSVLIYYAGHGYLDPMSGTGFWIPVDGGTEKYAQENWIPNTQIRGFISRMKARHVALISDSCFSGDILNPTRGSPSDITSEYFRAAYQRVSRQVLTSGASESVPDNSPFAMQLKLALAGNRQPYLDTLMLYSEVRLGVSGSLPLFGSFEGSGHQDGGSFLLFLRDVAGSQPAAATVFPATTGELYVTTDPSGAEVSLDGERKGTSPLLITEVPVGRRLRMEARSDNRVASTEVALDKAALQDVNLVLQTEKGNVVIMSTERAVRVVLDGRALGDLGSGLFRDIEAGSHSLELVGTGMYWKGEITVSASKTADVRAEPYSVAEIVYDVPFGAEATVSGGGTSQTVRWSGKLANLRAGRYEVAISGGEYDTMRLTVDLTRGQSYELKPYRTGTLVVESTPSGAEVRVGGVYRGTTPLTLADVPAGNASVELALSGYATERREVAVSGGKRSETSVTLAAATGPQMVLVEGGTFQLGSTSGEADEKPVRSVTVSSFYLGKYEVTQKEWVAVMGSNPSRFKGDDKPVEQVSWLDAVAFCNRLSVKAGLQPCYTIGGPSVSCDFSRNGYRLPTEAEWEYAAKGGRSSRGYTYGGGYDVGAVAWYYGNSGRSTHAVGTRAANELGLYDMSGNVYEWCWDWYGSYSAGSQTDPRGPSSGERRILRGGSWNYLDTYLRSANRDWDGPGDRNSDYGFRVVRPRA